MDKVTNLLAEKGPAKAKDLADILGVDHEELREVLIDLERRGIVYRTGRTRGTRWWLG